MKDYEKIEGKFRFYGYIAYTHDNYSEAKKLHKFLESYKLDFVLGKKNKTLSPIFIDKRDLYGDLNQSEYDNLENSKYLIVVCSSELKIHDYAVNQEINYFLNTHSLEDILLINVSETKFPEKECCPSAIISAYESSGSSLPIMPNIYDALLKRSRKTEFDAYAKLVSQMSDQAEDTVKISYKRQKKLEKAKTLTIIVLSIVITAIISLMAFFYPSVSLKVFSENKWIEQTATVNADESIEFQINAKNISKEKANLIINLADGIELDKNSESVLVIRDANGNTTQINDERVFNEGIDLRKKGIETGDFTCTFSIVIQEYFVDESMVLSIDINGHCTEREIILNRNTIPSCGWGDSSGGREDFTLEEVNSGAVKRVVFNSISDSVIGHEKNFVGAREANGDFGKDNIWNANEITVEDGKTYIIRMYIDNNGRDGDSESTANNVKAGFSLPMYVDNYIPIYGIFSADNATPQTYWDGVLLKSSNKFYVEYVSGSALLENNGIGADGGYKLDDEIIIDEVLLGYDKLDGIVPAGYQYACYVTIEVKVHFTDSTEHNSKKT